MANLTRLGPNVPGGDWTPGEIATTQRLLTQFARHEVASHIRAGNAAAGVKQQAAVAAQNSLVQLLMPSSLTPLRGMLVFGLSVYSPTAQEISIGVNQGLLGTNPTGGFGLLATGAAAGIPNQAVMRSTTSVTGSLTNEIRREPIAVNSSFQWFPAQGWIVELQANFAGVRDLTVLGLTVNAVLTVSFYWVEVSDVNFY